MKNTIIIYYLIISSVSAQDSSNVFNLFIRPGFGVNKLIANSDGLNPSVPTSSGFGFNISLGALVKFNFSTKINISTGVGLKLNRFNTTISNIFFPPTHFTDWRQAEINEVYTNNYLTIPLLFQFKLNEKLNIGFGISYDYLLNSDVSKTAYNISESEIEYYGNNFYSGNYSILLYYQWSLKKSLSLIPTILISPNKTTSQIFSNSTGPSISLDIQLELKI